MFRRFAATVLGVGMALAIGSAVPARAQASADVDAARTSAIAHVEKGETILAIAAATRAVSLAESKHGPLHPVVADCLEVLGVAASDQSYLLRALAIREAAQGKDHEATAQTLFLLAMFGVDKPEAEALLKRALDIRERTGPREEYGKVLSMLSAHYVMTNRLADANALKPKLDALAKELGVKEAKD